jgi:hypothetical protein
MESESPCTHIAPDLTAIAEELRKREPIFHRAARGKNSADFERLMAPDYWEVGASGGRYSRASILQHLEQHAPMDAETAGWVCSEFGLRRLGRDTFLLTYLLDQKGRITQRATIWKQYGNEWQIVYHQGTIMAERQ